VLATALACALAAPAQESLTCGVPVVGTLMPGGKNTYRITTRPGVEVVIQSSALSPELGTRRMRLTGAGAPKITCTGILQFTGQSEDALTLEIEQCGGTTGGTYTLTLNVVSDDPDNCGWRLPCGTTPAGTEFLVPGEVDSFQVALTAGQPADLTVNYLDPGNPAAPLLSVYDPDGREITRILHGDVTVEPAVSGTYTALVSAFGAPMRRAYRMELYHPGCRPGPTITQFGIIDGFANPIPPIGFDPAGRPIFNHEIGRELSLFVEARAGANKVRPGDFTVPQAGRDADVQVLFSNPLGDGSPAVCDTVEPNIGGVPATIPLTFEPTTQETLDHIDDMGCRFDNGQGRPIGRRDPDEACTFTGQRFGFSFVDRESDIQYCTSRFENAWEFADRDTTVAVRAKDVLGNFGEPREIVVRIGDPQPPTLTPTPTPTPRAPTRTATMSFTRPPPRSETPTRTPTDRRTPTITPTPDPSLCAGDCGNDRVVSVDEIVLMLNIALGSASLDDCRAGDSDGDGNIFIPDLLKAVNHLIGSCPPLSSL
jgi:hypothetical protein